jgi:tetraether lipid synthase
MGAFADFADLVHGPNAEWGQVSCGCHPNCGVGTAVMIDKENREMRPVPEFLNIPGLVKDMQKITDAARGKWMSNIMMGLALLKHYNPYTSPSQFTLYELFKKFDKSFGLTGKDYGKVSGDRTEGDIEKRRSDRWNFLFIAGMWFQDLFNYDFRRTEMCIIPYGTQEGEISFCAYNTGIGWRNIIENMHQNATVAKWYQEHGRHEIFAGGHNVELADKSHSLVLNEIDLTRPNKPQMEGPKTAHEEAVMMRKLYQEMVLQKQSIAKEADKPVQIKGLTRKKEEPAEAVLV